MVKQVKKATSDTVLFTKNLARMIVAVSLVSVGVYAVYQGRKESTAVYTVALLFAGAVNVLVGLVALYRALMHKEG